MKEDSSRILNLTRKLALDVKKLTLNLFYCARLETSYRKNPRRETLTSAGLLSFQIPHVCELL